MTPDERQLLYDALMQGTPEDPQLAYEFSQMVDHDLSRIEPIIDAMLKAAKAPAPATEGSGEFTFTDALINFVQFGPDAVKLEILISKRMYSVVVHRMALRAFGAECIRQSHTI